MESLQNAAAVVGDKINAATEAGAAPLKPLMRAVGGGGGAPEQDMAPAPAPTADASTAASGLVSKLAGGVKALAQQGLAVLDNATGGGAEGQKCADAAAFMTPEGPEGGAAAAPTQEKDSAAAVAAAIEERADKFDSLAEHTHHELGQGEAAMKVPNPEHFHVKEDLTQRQQQAMAEETKPSFESELAKDTKGVETPDGPLQALHLHAARGEEGADSAAAKQVEALIK
ncbi:hypothetical protein QJQ45_026615 [Haematococcus lacustris]|nr:hypothetical protein QJQ45_026615 [Haematococcus lacustris]